MDRASLLRRAAALLITPSALAALGPAAPAAAAPALAPAVTAAGGYLHFVNVGPKLWPELLDNLYEVTRRAGYDTLHIEGHGWRMLPEMAHVDPFIRYAMHNS